MTLRLEPGPRERWVCCEHCAHEWLSQWIASHDEPCECQKDQT